VAHFLWRSPPHNAYPLGRTVDASGYRTDAEIAQAYVELQERWWAWEAVKEATMHDPEHAWQLVLAIVAATDSSLVLEVLGSGPLEDLLSDYGDQFIDRCEEQARVDPKFRESLSSIWRTERMSEAVWSRIEQASGGAGAA
jgi:hypothetical protein